MFYYTLGYLNESRLQQPFATQILVVVLIVASLISRTSLFDFRTYGLFVVCEKVEEALILILNMQETTHNNKQQ